MLTTIAHFAKAWAITLVGWLIIIFSFISTSHVFGQDFQDAKFSLENIKRFSCEAKINTGPHERDTLILAHAEITFLDGDTFQKTIRYCPRFKECSAECGEWMDNLTDEMIRKRKVLQAKR